MNAMKIAECLRTLREELGETQTKTADAVGIAQATYAMYELGKRIPTDETKIKLAEHFGKTVQQIFFDNNIA